MKKMRKLLPAFAMLLVSAIMMSTASFAWFSMGTKANATGMQVKATASSSLVISTSAERAAFLAADQDIVWGTSGDAALPTGYDSLKPATHSSTYETSGTGLARPADETKVNAGTGALTDDTMVEATANYYVDFVAYIATVGGAALSGQDLYANVRLPADISTTIHNAVTIDFWVETYTDGATNNDLAYKTKTNFKTIDASELNGLTNAQGVKIAENITVPLLVADESDETVSYIKVIMRVYFDGALEESAGYTYVRNQLQSAVNAAFSVEFEAKNTTYVAP